MLGKEGRKGINRGQQEKEVRYAAQYSMHSENERREKGRRDSAIEVREGGRKGGRGVSAEIKSGWCGRCIGRPEHEVKHDTLHA